MCVHITARKAIWIKVETSYEPPHYRFFVAVLSSVSTQQNNALKNVNYTK